MKKSVWDRKIVEDLVDTLEDENHPLVSRVIEVVRDLDITTFLDVGCGVGRFYQLLGRDYDYIGVDKSSDMIDYCKSNHDAIFYEADISSLPFLNNSMDLVFSFDVLSHIPFPHFDRGLREIFRVAKKFIVLGTSYTHDSVIENVYEHDDHEFSLVFTNRSTYESILSNYEKKITFIEVPANRVVSGILVSREMIVLIEKER